MQLVHLPTEEGSLLQQQLELEDTLNQVYLCVIDDRARIIVYSWIMR